jgi:hypothetical protein
VNTDGCGPMGKYQTSAGEVSSGSKDINTIATRHPTINGHLYRVNRLTGAGHYPFYVTVTLYAPFDLYPFHFPVGLYGFPLQSIVT